jgi:hypothetical protein
MNIAIQRDADHIAPATTKTVALRQTTTQSFDLSPYPEAH